MAWTGTSCKFNDDGTVERVEYHSPDHPDGKHGNYGFHIKGIRAADGDWVDFDDPVFVMVHDNSKDGLSDEELRKIAEESLRKPIYWSDDRLCYWMYDFNVWDHWCEMVDVPDESHYECLHINVYE